MEANLKSQIKYFIVVFLIVFVVTFIVLNLFAWVPKNFQVTEAPLQNIENLKITDDDLPKNEMASSVVGNTTPDQVIIEKINVNAKIEKPTSIRVDVLDEALRSGAVYYPGSGTIEKGNIFLFGHSTNWAVVQNQAYKTFNDLDKLVGGDTIQLIADGKNYFYKVNKVTLVDAEDALVEFDNSGRNLTISTCNTFGEKQERWVVEAELVE